MKKILLLCLLTFSLFSCSIDDDVQNVQIEFLPIESAVLPSAFEFGTIHEISVTYFRPSTCHVFNNFYYEINENERTVAVVAAVFQNENCQPFEPETEEEEVSFNFQVTSNETYTFKFWQGVDENDNDVYYIVEVPVIQ